jgi:hypothetical protein
MRLLKKTSKDDLLFFDNYGILRFDLGGKIMLLFTVEILALWISFMLLGRWDYFYDTDYGKGILSLDIIFLSTTFFSIVTKGKLINIYHTEVAKQISNLLFFIMVFLIIYHYTPEEINNKIRLDNPSDNLYFYTNPVMMSYIFILVFMICFYVIYNSLR